MAGESPARFRDRLLLERAAHLVATTDRRLQDIAADCGFRGYDVFVRAFRRELGALPSQWRAEPSSYAIDCPGDVHFHPPDGLSIPARRSDPGDLVVAMAEQHVRLVGDLVGRGADVDVILAGDVCYDRDMTPRVLGWLARSGARVLLGDPDRAYLPQSGLTPIASYDVPTTRALEGVEVKRARVFSPAPRRS